MKTSEVLAYFGGVRRTASVLKVWPQSIYTWGEYPPKGKQYEVQVKSNGELKAEGEDADEFIREG